MFSLITLSVTKEGHFRMVCICKPDASLDQILVLSAYQIKLDAQGMGRVWVRRALVGK
jgi:hypothetical protein